MKTARSNVVICLARLAACALLVLAGGEVRCACATPGAAPPAAPPVTPMCATRVSNAVALDGRLNDEAWKQACRVEQWFETTPGDNVAPKVTSVAYLAYDDRYLYAGFDLADPDPSRIRAPLGDRDSLTPYMDHVGMVLDARGDGKTAVIFAASARAIQYDSLLDDSQQTDDRSPDYYWDAAARIDGHGWTLEMRIPFSTLRYTDRNPTSWGIVLYRIYPRDVVRKFESTTVPRGITCWVCRANPLGGLRNLPLPTGLIAVPYVNGSRVAERDSSRIGLSAGRLAAETGGDVKWTPAAGHAIDVTLNPDFSQIEADATQIAANERFALFYAEKRPFFLEGSDLFATPLQALHTRTITAPLWGARATGRRGGTSYTALVARDQGGGSVVIPGALSSAVARQDFASWAVAGRAKHDIGSSFVGFLVSDREIDGGGYNRVAGPDFEWRPNLRERIVGQWLVTRTQTPDRNDLAAQWDGRRLGGSAGVLRWYHTARHLDWIAAVRAVSTNVRADNGYMPQVGSLRTYAELGYTVRPKGVVNAVRPFAIADRFIDWDGGLLSRETSLGVGLRGPVNVNARLAAGSIRTGPVVVPQTRLLVDVVSSPSPLFSRLQLTATAGESIDFDNHRAGTGTDIRLSATLRPSIHLQVQVDAGRRELFVRRAADEARLFSARLASLHATYSFNRRTFVRLIAQHLDTRRDPSLYLVSVQRRSASLDASALFAYKVNWQTVFFAGFGDDRTLDSDERLVPARRSLFVKLSYAFQV